MASSTASGRPLEFRCLACDLPLEKTDREGVEIDFCPNCRSIWLDRGELERLVNRLGSWYPETAQGYEQPWGEDDERIGPSSRLDDLFDVR